VLIAALTAINMQPYLYCMQPVSDCSVCDRGHTHLVNGLFSRTTWVSWHQKG